MGAADDRTERPTLPRGKEPAAGTELPAQVASLFTTHPRLFEQFRYVYPVVSRRSRGVSIGVNLNPDKVCNFDCVYCQVDRSTPPAVREVDEAQLLGELEAALDLVLGGQLFAHPRFAATPPELRRLNDIAFSGDGEPTTYRRFAELMTQVVELKRRRALGAVKLVLITNATMLHRPAVIAGLEAMMAAGGEIWAKLEAGTEAYYRRVERTSVPLARVLANITATAQRWPVTIQALFMLLDGQPPSANELDAFCDRLAEIAAGGQLRLVQIYTVARQPAESFVAPLADAQVDEIVERVRTRTGLAVEGYYGASAGQ
ncbi:MAG: radical SAM protein [Pirellulales bacterium]|nr:radical SAM protein [Pirellulales bacterium]